jgi:protein O-mannosyl-transferase
VPDTSLSPERLPRTWLLLLALAVIAVAPHAVGIEGGWIFDDTVLIAQNPYVHGFEHWLHWFVRDFWDVKARGVPGHNIFWRPLVTASYALDWVLGGGSPAVFHGTNLLLHAAVTVLTFLVLRRWLKSPLPAFLATLLLALHPFRTESVTWISGRPDPLMTLGVLLAMQGIAMRLGGKRAGIAIEVVGTAIAYLSKEHAVVLPAIAAVEVLVTVGPRWSSLRRPAVRVVGVQVLVAGAYLATRQLMAPLGFESGNYPFLLRTGIVFETLGRYVGIIVWPKDLTFGAALMYLDSGVPSLNLRYVTLGVAVVVIAVALVIWGSRRKPELAVGILALAASLFPVSNVISMGYSVFVSPRLLYLPALPLAFLVGLGLRHALETSQRAQRTTLLLVGATTIALGARNVTRSMDYQNADRFWRAEAEVSPDYFPTIEYFTRQALQNRRPRLALRLTHVAFSGVSSTVARQYAPRMMARALQAVLQLTSDRDQASLERIYLFIVQVRAHQHASLNLPEFQLKMDLPANSPAADLFLEEPVAEPLLLEAAARTGKWREVRDVAQHLLDIDPTSSQAIALQSTSAHDFEVAERAIDEYLAANSSKETREFAHKLRGAIAVLRLFDQSPDEVPPPALADAYIRTAAWGKAYLVLQPHLAVPREPAVTDVLAEVAFCAGEGEVASRLLAPLYPPPVIEAKFHDWRLKMQWVDAPLEVGELPSPPSIASRLEKYDHP